MAPAILLEAVSAKVDTSEAIAVKNAPGVRRTLAIITASAILSQAVALAIAALRKVSSSDVRAKLATNIFCLPRAPSLVL